MMSFVSCHQARVYANLQRYQSILTMTIWLDSQEFKQVTVRMSILSKLLLINKNVLMAPSIIILKKMAILQQCLI